MPVRSRDIDFDQPQPDMLDSYPRAIDFPFYHVQPDIIHINSVNYCPALFERWRLMVCCADGHDDDPPMIQYCVHMGDIIRYISYFEGADSLLMRVFRHERSMGRTRTPIDYHYEETIFGISIIPPYPVYVDDDGFMVVRDMSGKIECQAGSDKLFKIVL